MERDQAELLVLKNKKTQLERAPAPDSSQRVNVTCVCLCTVDGQWGKYLKHVSMSGLNHRHVMCTTQGSRTSPALKWSCHKIPLHSYRRVHLVIAMSSLGKT